MEELDLHFKQTSSLHPSDPTRLKVVIKETEPYVNILKLLMNGISAIIIPFYILFILYTFCTLISNANHSYLWKSVLLGLLLLMEYYLYIVSKIIAVIVTLDYKKKK